ncbi:GNAT family N-acetyltransferase [Glaesserella parasuis]|uniref:GNAT family N-acetyltransferase n=1 Tax=Glaesserella parasuis TaxID=738 RepID=UPI000415706B|nr:GNAT family N-acetyltransferase [Glaesserella parasuis]ATW45458.1 tRNA cytosine(34) acetyltransferase TmcA [Glaesserella parasuis str. Nagasaki]EYE72979.1 acetyltransferase [Glaesserella parasuis str. Nagasaki]MDP0069439.1 GNAT family N-acetyltransferase [Glaesserella parasuis]MDP0245355.1 GNAT family N-acetyltransferase [Glaesserella parasuis]MDP0279538.1 GNAT family N-acetyltransferase [Glaesserella parasuis]
MRHLTVIDHLPSSFETADVGGIFLPDSPISLPFSNAKTLLGQEFPYAVYDMRASSGVCLNLDALAIVAGTIQEGGTLYLVCPEWDNLEQQVDFDALRWNAQQPIATPNFFRYFKALVNEILPPFTGEVPCEAGGRGEIVFTQDQQNIFDNLPLDPADIHLILAPRGRGKSTLSGKLAEKLSQQYAVSITARSHSALPNFWKGIESDKVKFFAPDRLIQMIEQKNISPNQWLFVDEAASLPLPMLQQFCAYFDKVVLTTTTQNYEGTGRGFCLKFLPTLSRSTKQWTLSQPLRWGENDPLEAFINQLLLLEDKIPPSAFGSSPRKQGERSIEQYTNFYHLLAQAHYKTTPTDLRRLFDAPDQHYFYLEEQERLIAGCWAVNEGGLDEELTQAIWRGERRPQGSLVAQYLCFQGNLPDACRLKSVRISRIAVQPEYQKQGYGKRLVSQIISQMPPLVDFVSVSFGLTPELLRFWQSCGFSLVQVTPTPEASSGYHSAMMIYPLSVQGKIFAQQAKQQFERDFPLLPFADRFQHIAISTSLNSLILDHNDERNLQGFIYAQRTLTACYVSLKRLYINHNSFDFLSDIFTNSDENKKSKQKQWVIELKNKLKTISSIGKT